MKLQTVFSQESIIINLESKTKKDLFDEMLKNVITRFPDINREEAASALWKREKLMSTGVLHDIAVPHCGVDTATGVVGVIGISKDGIDYDSLDKAPVHYVFMIICNTGEVAQYLDVLKGIAVLLKNQGFVNGLKSIKSANELYELIGNCETYFDG